MKILENFFDHYVINARIKVAFFISFPIVVTIVVWLPQAYHWGLTLVTLLTVFGCFSLFSNTISNLGNKLQAEFYVKWGGEPTTTLLRHRDNTIDPYTKNRIHNWLQDKVKDLKLPSAEEEAQDPVDADSRYASSTHFLREFSRDKKKFKMIYHDLVAYGFARNLLAVKTLGIIISVVALLASSLLILITLEDMSLFIENGSKVKFDEIVSFIPVLVAIAFLVVYFFFINESHLKARAERYAKSLLAICDHQQ